MSGFKSRAGYNGARTVYNLSLPKKYSLFWELLPKVVHEKNGTWYTYGGKTGCEEFMRYLYPGDEGFDYFLQIRVMGASEGQKKKTFMDQNLISSLEIEYKIVLILTFYLYYMKNIFLENYDVIPT